MARLRRLALREMGDRLQGVDERRAGVGLNVIGWRFVVIVLRAHALAVDDRENLSFNPEMFLESLPERVGITLELGELF